MKRVIALLLLLFMSTAAFAQKKNDKMPPLPSKLLAAKTVFLTVDTDWTNGHTEHAYAALKKWGRFEVVGDQETADVILSISNNDAGSVGFGTGSVIGSAVTGVGVSVPLHTYHLRVYDRETQALLFVASTDERVPKSRESKRLIAAFKKRMDGAEKP